MFSDAACLAAGTSFALEREVHGLQGGSQYTTFQPSTLTGTIGIAPLGPPNNGTLVLTLDIPATTVQSSRTGETQTLTIANLVVGQHVITHTDHHLGGGGGATYSGWLPGK